MLLELGLEVVEGEAGRCYAVDVHLQDVLAGDHLRDGEMVADEEDVFGSDVSVDQEGGRGLRVERFTRVHFQNGRAGRVVRVRTLLVGGRSHVTLSPVLGADVADPHSLEEGECFVGGVDSEDFPEGVYRFALRQKDLLISTRMLTRELRDVVHAVLVCDPYATVWRHVLRYLFEGVVG